MAQGVRRRALLVGFGAFLLFGTWAIIANREHSLFEMLRAGFAQGTFSFVSSTCGVYLIEWLYGRGRTATQKLLLGAVGAPMIILATMTTGHLLARTPNVVTTLLPSWISGAIFCVTYTFGLRRMVPSAEAMH